MKCELIKYIRNTRQYANYYRIRNIRALTTNITNAYLGCPMARFCRDQHL